MCLLTLVVLDLECICVYLSTKYTASTPDGLISPDLAPLGPVMLPLLPLLLLPLLLLPPLHGVHVEARVEARVEDRVDCQPGEAANQAICAARGCLWDQVGGHGGAGGGGDGVPLFHLPFLLLLLPLLLLPLLLLLLAPAGGGCEGGALVLPTS